MAKVIFPEVEPKVKVKQADQTMYAPRISDKNTTNISVEEWNISMLVIELTILHTVN